ncbi:hypothetical protein [Actinokineospora enzanensis]|nr:hypothetical protein [Actinokineospora enzanensis]
MTRHPIVAARVPAVVIEQDEALCECRCARMVGTHTAGQCGNVGEGAR